LDNRTVNAARVNPCAALLIFVGAADYLIS
jgi:hypothetical protein